MQHKSKILHLYRLLSEKTDDEHNISTTQIIDELGRLGITLNRKTVASDIALLCEFGVDILTVRSSQNMYYIGGRDFELPEVKLLVDAVESSKIFTHKKTKNIVEKLSKLVSENQAKLLGSSIFIDERIKPANEEVYYSIDKIQQSIEKKAKIEFKYKDYFPDKSITYKHNGQIYSFSPYALVWDNDHYYAIGFCENHDKISTFRVDRMAKVCLTKNKAKIPPDDFSVAEYLKTIFDMFEGKLQQIELECTNDLMNVIVDKFGRNVKTQVIDYYHFKAVVDVSVSSNFFGWVFKFAGKIRISSPDDVKSEYKQMLENVLDNV